jgi:hypothetical protein
MSDNDRKWNYGPDDAADDPEKDLVVEAELGLEEELQKYYDTIPEEKIGSGWFDQRMSTFHTCVDLSTTKKFSTVPREWDKMPASVPSDHPLRAIASLLNDADADSTIRVFSYALTDPMAIDLLIHHASDKIVKIIMNHDDHIMEKIRMFLQRFERFNSWDVFYSRMQVRVADTMSPPCSRYSSMHDKRIITPKYCTYGSYNLSCAARYANREAIVLVSTDDSEIKEFDGLWRQLEHRTLEQVYPSFYPASFRVPKHARTS